MNLYERKKCAQYSFVTCTTLQNLPNLVVNNDVDDTTCSVVGKVGHSKTFIDHTLSCKSSVTVKEKGYALVAVGVLGILQRSKDGELARQRCPRVYNREE